jgi:xanthine dehydrogenase YagT iron-sulfur-binding subunit
MWDDSVRLLDRHELDRHAGALGHETGQPCGKPPCAQCATSGDTQAALGPLPKFGQSVKGGDQPGQQTRAGLGEHKPRVEAPDQLAARVQLQPPHTVTHGTLRQTQLLGSTREAEVACHRFEGNQLSERGQAAHATIVVPQGMADIHAAFATIICPSTALPFRLGDMHHPQPPSPLRHLKLEVNEREVEVTLESFATLAELLRDHLLLRGTKVACNQAACGACTVLVDGAPVFACHTLAAQCQGSRVQTVEGLVAGAGLHALQQAFIDRDALQCGYCTPGMLMALKGALDAGVPPNRAALAQAISGNTCRCGAYEHILEAALDVAQFCR